MPSVIAISDLKKSIPVGFWGRQKRLLDGVTFEVDAGATVGFVGRNGAGKSTTIKHVIGGCRPTSGEIRVLGGDPRDAAVRKRFGYMPELPYLPPTLTPMEIMSLHATLCDASDDKTAGLLERVDLARHARERIGGFSKGMQTRLSLALALLHDPELLILDEPMSGLDPVGRQLVRTILRELGEQGRTILFSTHVLTDVEALCDQVVVIDAGKVVYSGTTADAVGAVSGAWSVRVRWAGDGPPPGATAARREGDTWLLVVGGTDAVDVALGLRQAGVTVLALEPQRAGLEERLTALMGRSAS